MELKEFIAQTLKQINDGLQEGSDYISSKGGEGHSSQYFNVEFDVAVTTINDESSGTGGKIKVASILSGGAEREKSSSTTQYSHIKFHLPLQISKLPN